MRCGFTLLLIVFATTCFPQPYKSVLGSGRSQWYLTQTFYGLPFKPDIVQISLYDTVIDGLTYRKIGAYIPQVNGKPPLLGNPNVYSYGYLRSDADNSKLWYFNSDKNQERLIMDLTLAVGDSFFLEASAYGPRYYPVDSVYFDHLNRKNVRISYDKLRYTDDTAKHTLIFREGIGPDQGLFYQTPGGTTVHHTNLLCFTMNDTGYALPNGFCRPPERLATLSDLDNTGLKVFPNPTQDKIFFSGNQISSVRLLDAQGKIVYEKKDDYISEIILNHLPTQLLLLVAETHDGIILLQKIVLK